MKDSWTPSPRILRLEPRQHLRPMINSISCLALKLREEKDSAEVKLHIFTMTGQNSSRIGGWQLSEERLLLGEVIRTQRQNFKFL